MIHINDLSFGYSAKHCVLNQLQLSLTPGHIYGLLGKNGAGKSTLMKIMAGVLPSKQGEIKVLGFSPQDRDPDFLREIYLITEEQDLPALSVELYVRLYSPFYPRFNHAVMDTYLLDFQITKTQKLSALSHGQKKKFLLCFGLATDCKLLIMDEPTNGLDIPSKSQFRKMLANNIHEERTFIISTHQIRDLENLIDPIIMMDEGKVVFFQDGEQIAQKLAFMKQSERIDVSQVVYSEASTVGYAVVKRSKGMEESKPNLELLFHAVMHDKEKIQEVFNG